MESPLKGGSDKNLTPWLSSSYRVGVTLALTVLMPQAWGADCYSNTPRIVQTLLGSQQIQSAFRDWRWPAHHLTVSGYTWMRVLNTHTAVAMCSSSSDVTPFLCIWRCFAVNERGRFFFFFLCHQIFRGPSLCSIVNSFPSLSFFESQFLPTSPPFSFIHPCRQ